MEPQARRFRPLPSALANRAKWGYGVLAVIYPSKFSLPLLAALSIAACSSPQATVQASDSRIQVSQSQAAKIGRKIWVSECAGTVEGLTSWNKGESFGSFGIGHFIWYPAGQNGPFEESFPPLLKFLSSKGVAIPGWLKNTPDCPWPNRAAFERDLGGQRIADLRRMLKNSVPEQTAFIVARLESALPKMLSKTRDQDLVRGRFYAVAESANGIYALIDYVNFKGEGVKASESYKGQGWGLLQVLENMKGQPRGAAAAREFSASASLTLKRRVANSPPARNESRWLPGWLNRTAGYAKPF